MSITATQTSYADQLSRTPRGTDLRRAEITGMNLKRPVDPATAAKPAALAAGRHVALMSPAPVR